MTDSVDFAALEAAMREVPSVPLRERAAIAWRQECEPHEVALLSIAAALLDEVLGVRLAEAENVKTRVTDLDGNGKIDLTVDEVPFKVVVGGSNDPVLQVGIKNGSGNRLWKDITSLVELGYRLEESA